MNLNNLGVCRIDLNIRPQCFHEPIRICNQSNGFNFVFIGNEPKVNMQFERISVKRNLPLTNKRNNRRSSLTIALIYNLHNRFQMIVRGFKNRFCIKVAFNLCCSSQKLFEYFSYTCFAEDDINHPVWLCSNCKSALINYNETMQ